MNAIALAVCCVLVALVVGTVLSIRARNWDGPEKPDIAAMWAWVILGTAIAVLAIMIYVVMAGTVINAPPGEVQG